MGEITLRRLIFRRFNTTISCLEILLVETNDNCFQRSSVEILVDSILYPRNYHYWDAFWSHRSLCKALEIIVCSQNAHNLSREHLGNEFSCRQLEGIREALPSNHHHTRLYLSDCGDAETFLKQTNAQVLSTTNNAYVKLMTASWPEICLRAETDKLAAISVCQRREDAILDEWEDRRSTWLQIQNCVGVWKIHFTKNIRSNGTEKALFLFERLLDLENSDASFKDSVLS